MVTMFRIGRVLTVAIVLGAALFALAGLNVVREAVDRGMVDVWLLPALLPFALWSYGLRTLRWHTLARSVIPNVSPVVTSYGQVIGFAFSVTPGRMAELYKLKLLERSTGISVAQSLPAILIERLTDVIVFGMLLVGGALLHASATTDLQVYVPILAAVLGLGTLSLLARQRAFRSGPLRRVENFTRGAAIGRALLGRLALRRVSILLEQLRAGGRQVTRPETLALALVFVLLGRLGDGVVFWKVSLALGHPVSYPLALMVIGGSGLVGGFSLSPGGIGAAEAALVALITANGMPLGVAIVAAFTTRALLFWLWVLVGICAFAISHGYLVLRHNDTRRLADGRAGASEARPGTSVE